MFIPVDLPIEGSMSPAIIVVITAVIALLTAGLVFALALMIIRKRRKKNGHAAGEASVANNVGDGTPTIPSVLSPKEREIFALLLTEAAPKQIAFDLDLSVSAVKFHTKNIYRKLSIQSRVELLARFG
jgi:DNA-binding CsgD family transcriptional regulator